MSEAGVRANVEWWTGRIRLAEMELIQMRAMRDAAAGKIVVDFPTADAQWWEKKRQADLDDERQQRWVRADFTTYNQLRPVE